LARRATGKAVAYADLRLEDASEGNAPASSYIYEVSEAVRNTSDADAGFVMDH